MAGKTHLGSDEALMKFFSRREVQKKPLVVEDEEAPSEEEIKNKKRKTNGRNYNATKTGELGSECHLSDDDDDFFA